MSNVDMDKLFEQEGIETEDNFNYTIKLETQQEAEEAGWNSDILVRVYATIGDGEGNLYKEWTRKDGTPVVNDSGNKVASILFSDGHVVDSRLGGEPKKPKQLELRRLGGWDNFLKANNLKDTDLLGRKVIFAYEGFKRFTNDAGLPRKFHKSRFSLVNGPVPTTTTSTEPVTEPDTATDSLDDL